MSEITEKYVNPFTDYGFKRLFGEEPNKDLLKDFLNELLRDEQGEITDLQYLKNEQIDKVEFDHDPVFDCYCTNSNGENFLVELQKTKQEYFKDRSLYYAMSLIGRQSQIKGIDDDTPIYIVSILDFPIESKQNNSKKFRHYVKFSEPETHRVFFDNLTFIYLEIPKFNKTLDELETRFDKWLYALQNLTRLQSIPEKLQEKIFIKLFKVAEIS